MAPPDYTARLRPILERHLECSRVLMALVEWSEREQCPFDAVYLQFIDAIFSELRDLNAKAQALRHARRPQLALAPSPDPAEPDERHEKTA